MILVTGAAIALGIGVVAFGLPSEPGGETSVIRPPTSYPADLVDHESLGADAAPVVMELYADFQCPACKIFAKDLLPRLVDEFVAGGLLRIDPRDIAFLGREPRDESLELAVGARCAAAQDAYWPFHDLVFWNQGRENRGDHSAAFIADMAHAAGLEETAFDACVSAPEARAAIIAQTSAALGSGISSTPTLIVNGQPIVGVPDYGQLAALIRQLAGQATTEPASPS
jgi:protein-disulfide isomerase